ncbi:hypothetical protein CEXT_787201 [Caerostris extrusa]|uniref:Uncharacterized protein n=1 Tax=Caerostris extrusa TaxID=172846 RepID=A0AAV4MP76_CAEEX|nr:hypothetical protein CEXT_787201 [Caerostris extrusa]
MIKINIPRHYFSIFKYIFTTPSGLSQLLFTTPYISLNNFHTSLISRNSILIEVSIHNSSVSARACYLSTFWSRISENNRCPSRRGTANSTPTPNKIQQDSSRRSSATTPEQKLTGKQDEGLRFIW